MVKKPALTDEGAASPHGIPGIRGQFSVAHFGRALTSWLNILYMIARLGSAVTYGTTKVQLAWLSEL